MIRFLQVQKTESLASVVWPKGNVKQIIKVSNISVQQNSLYGKGSDTIKLLQYVENVYGSLTSFTGKFEVKQWRINIGEQGTCILKKDYGTHKIQ